MTMMMLGLSGAGVLLLAALAAAVLEDASASVRHLLWTTALAVLMVAPAFEMSGLRLEVEVPARWTEAVTSWVGDRVAIGAAASDVGPAVTTARTPAVTVVEAAPAPSEATGTTAPQARSGARVAPRAPSAEDRGPATATLVSTTTARRSGSGVGRAARSAEGLGSDVEAKVAEPVVQRAVTPAAGADPATMVFIVWASGALLLLLGTVLGHVRAYRLTVADQDEVAPSVRRRFHEQCVRLGLGGSVRLVVNRSMRVPATWGLRRASVVLPPTYETWPAETLDRVLLHELAHVQRRDCWTLLIGHVARALHWPNPLVWIAVRCQRNESERASDDLVLAAGTRPSAYAADLVALVRGLHGIDAMPSAIQPMAGPEGVGDRVRAVLDANRDRALVGRSAALFAGVVALLLSGAATIVVPVLEAQERQRPPRAMSPAAMAVPPAPPAALEAIGVPRVTEPLDAPIPPEPRRMPAPPDPQHVPAPFEAIEPPSEYVPVSPIPSTPAPPYAYPLRTVSSYRLAAEQSQELCVFRATGSRSSSTSVNDERVRIRWETDDCRVDIEMEGEVEFATDDSGVRALADGAVFEIEERIGRERRRVRYQGLSGGRIERAYWRNGDEVAFGPEAAAWLSAILPEMFRHTTINAEPRVRRMVAEGGPERVFAELEDVHSDHVTGRYLELLMEVADLSEREYTRVIQVAGAMDSDHQVGELLLGVIAAAGLRPAFQEPLLEAASGIESDHQRGRVLQALLESPLRPDQMNAVIRSATTIESDHQLSTLLTVVARSGRLDQVGREEFLGALQSIESDHAHGVVVHAFLDAGSVSSTELSRILEMTHGIDSDHERATILQRIASENDLTGAQVTEYLRSASELQSDHQIAQTALVVVNRGDFTGEQLALVLTMADRVSSDHQRATILDAVIRRRALDQAEIREVLMVARGLASDHQMATVLGRLVEEASLSADTTADLLDATRRIGSSHQRAEVLLAVVGRGELDAPSRARVEELAGDLSRSDRERVLRALAG